MGEPRMFRVIVLGGIALAAARGCGGSVQAEATPAKSDGGPDAQEEFPSELPAFTDATPEATQDAAEEFPSELPAFTDATPGDAPVVDCAFPIETAFVFECGAPATDAADAAADASDASDAGFPSEAPI